MRLIDADTLNEHKFVGNKFIQLGGSTYGKTLETVNRAYQQGWNDAIDAIIDNAPTIKPPEVLYLCEGHGCSAMCGGKSEYCKHTSNIESAKNFESITGGDRCIYVEKDKKTTNGGDDTRGGKE